MADKRKDLADDEFALPSLDLDDLDDGFDIPDQPEGPVRKFTVNFKRGFLEQTKTRTMMRNFLRGALPDGYSRAMAGAETAWEEGADIARSVAEHADDDLETIASKTEQLLPKLKRFAPKRAYDKIESRVSDARKGFASRDRRTLSQLQEESKTNEEAEILRQALEGLDESYREEAQTSEQSAQRRFESERIERSIHEQIKRGQIDGINRQLGAIRGSVEHQVTYQDQITYRYQRKSLEMQYRSYFVLRDLRSYADATKKLHENAYSAIVHNTGLPDHAKTTQAERVRFGMQDRTSSAISGMMSQTLAEYMANYLPQLKENIKDKAISGVRGVGSMLSMGGPPITSETIGRMAGSEASEQAQRYAIPFLSRLARPFMRKASDRMGGYDHLANYAMNNAGSMIQDYTQDLNNTAGWRGMLKNAVRSVAPSYFLDDQIKDGSYQTIDREAAFNQLTQRSIVDIIPGYLSRLLHETRMMRTGRDDLDREVYDVTSGKFSGFKEAKANARKRVVTEVQRQNINNTLDEVIGSYDGDGELSPQAQEALRERLLRDAARGGRFDARQYAEGGYSADTDEEIVEELTSFFKNRFEFDSNGRLVRSKDNFERLDAYSNAFLELRNVVPDPRGELRRLHGAGSQEMLRELGLIDSKHGVDRINYDRIWELYRSGDPVVDPEPPEAGTGGGPTTPPNDSPSFRQKLNDRVRNAGDVLSTRINEAREHDWKGTAQAGRDALNRRVDTVREKSKGMGFNPDVFSKFQPVTDTSMSFVTSQVNKAKDAFTPVGDVYNGLREQPLLLGRDLQAGNYIDVNTGNVIRSLKDVTGEIRNRSGWVVATAADLAGDLQDSTGRSLKSSMITDAMERGQGIAGSFGRGVRSQVQDWAAKVNELKDIYLPNREEPLMLARDIKAGKYYDVNSGERIETADDITGEVKDEDGNTVVTPEEYETGLVDNEGRSVKSGRAKAFMSRYLSITTAPGKLLGRVGMTAGRAAARGVGRLLKGKDRDAYLPGEDEPRITVQGLKRGQYFDAESGDAITSFDAIKGGVVDADGNMILSAEERQELVTAGGKKHRAAQGIVRRMIRAGTTGLAKKAAGAYWNWTKNYYRKLPGRLAKLPKVPGKIGSFLTAKPLRDKVGEWLNDDEEEVPEDAAKTPTDGLLKRILKTLDKRLPDEAPEKGSWQSILARRKKEDKEEAAEEESEKREGSLLKRLFGGVGGLLGAGGRWDEEEEEEEDDGDINAYGEYDGGDKEDKDRKKRRNRRNRPRKPRGKIGRLWQGAKNLAKGGWDKVKGLGRSVAGSKWGARALNVGKSFLGPKGWLARGAMAAGSAIAGAITAPVAITAAVVGGVAVGGYMYYKKRKRASGVFRELRLTQYGFSPNGWSNPGKVLDIEDVLSPGVVHQSSGMPKLELNKIDMDKLFEVSGVDKDDEEEVAVFAGWLEHRFKPIFLAYNHALAELAPEVTIQELDDKLPKEKGMKFLDMVTFKDNENSPYLYMHDPFDPGDTVGIDMDDIKDRIEEVKEVYKEHDEDGSSTAGKTAVAAATSGASANARRRVRDRATQTANRQNGLSGINPEDIKPYQFNRGRGGANRAVAAAGGGVVTIASTTGSGPAGFGKPSGMQSQTTDIAITPLQALRLRAYGFGSDLDQPTAEALLALEDRVFDGVTVQRSGNGSRMSFSLKPRELFDWWQEHYPNVPVVSGHEGPFRFGVWLQKKMGQVVKEYVQGVLQTGTTENYATAELDMTMDQKLQVATRIVNMRVIRGSGTDRYTQNIWQTHDYIQAEEPDWQEVAKLAEVDYEFMKRVAKEVKEKPQAKAAEATQSQANDTSRQQKPRDIHGQPTGIGTRPNPTQRGGGGRPSWTSDGGPMWQQYMPKGQVQMKGNVFDGFTKGNGGVWETIPMPRSNKSMEAAIPTLSAVAQMTGVDLGILVTFVSIESAFDYLVTAPTSSATGWFQFINATWDQMLNEHGSKYQLPADDGQRSLRKDPRANALMGAEFLKGNYNFIVEELGRRPSDTDLYLAHFLGAAGAVKFLKQDTNAIASQVFPAAAKANKSIFILPSGRARTIGEVYQVMDEKVAKHRHGFGGRDSGQHTANDEQYSPAQPQVANGDMIQVNGADMPTAYKHKSQVGRPPGQAPISMAQRASSTVNPVNQTSASPGMSMGQGRPPTGAPGASGVPNTPQEDPVIQHQAEQRRQALAADRRQQVQNAQTANYSKEMGMVMEKQLKIQESMRDYLKEIAGNIAGAKVDEASTSSSGGTGQERPSNDTSKPTRPPQGPGSRSTPLPVNLKE